jgi:hypothetical protein
MLQNSHDINNQGFPYVIFLTEGSGSVPRTNESRSRGPNTYGFGLVLLEINALIYLTATSTRMLAKKFV